MSQRTNAGWGKLLAALTLLAATCGAQAQVAETIYHGGMILTIYTANDWRRASM